MGSARTTDRATRTVCLLSVWEGYLRCCRQDGTKTSLFSTAGGQNHDGLLHRGRPIMPVAPSGGTQRAAKTATTHTTRHDTTRRGGAQMEGSGAYSGGTDLTSGGRGAEMGTGGETRRDQTRVEGPKQRKGPSGRHAMPCPCHAHPWPHITRVAETCNSGFPIRPREDKGHFRLSRVAVAVGQADMVAGGRASLVFGAMVLRFLAEAAQQRFASEQAGKQREGGLGKVWARWGGEGQGFYLGSSRVASTQTSPSGLPLGQASPPRAPHRRPRTLKGASPRRGKLHRTHAKTWRLR